MTKKLIHVLIFCVLVLECFSLTGCRGQYNPVSELEERPGVIKRDSRPDFDRSVPNKSNYEVTDGKIADYLNYNYKDRSMYIAGLKVFEEFGTSNEGNVSIHTSENTLTFDITKSTGTVTGAVDGPHVYFKMDLATNKIIDKKFDTAPNYAELGRTELTKQSKEIIELTDKRMVEIGQYFRKLIGEIETN